MDAADAFLCRSGGRWCGRPLIENDMTLLRITIVSTYTSRLIEIPTWDCRSFQGITYIYIYIYYIYIIVETFTLELLLISVSFAAWAAGHVGGPDGNPLQREAGSATALRTAEGTLQLGTERTVHVRATWEMVCLRESNHTYNWILVICTYIYIYMYVYIDMCFTF